MLKTNKQKQRKPKTPKPAYLTLTNLYTSITSKQTTYPDIRVKTVKLLLQKSEKILVMLGLAKTS